MNSSQLNVAVVEPVGGHGGCNYYDFSLCKSVVAAGGKVTLYTCDKTVVLGNEGFPVARSYVGIYGKDSAWIRALRFLRGSLAALVGARRRGAQLAHFHFYHVGPLEVFNIGLARILGLKVVITAHDVEAFKKGLSVPAFVRWAYRTADRVIAHNQVSRAELDSSLQVAAASIHVIPHGNHLEYVPAEVTRAVARERLGYAANDRVVVFFGQIKEVKGLDVLIKAFAEARLKDSRLRLLIAGKVWKDDFTKYENLIQELKIDDVCNCQIRYIPDEEVPYFYQCADLIALPYLKIYQSGVVLMAMSYGRPVLVSDIPGMLEVVEDNKSGLVFRSADASHMARRISDAFSDANLLDRVAAGGLRRVTEDFDWLKIGQQTVNVYRSVVGKHGN